MITSWHPERILGPVSQAFAPACYSTARLARMLAPKATGKLSRSVRVSFGAGQAVSALGAFGGVVQAQRAFLHAPGVPYIYPVVTGAQAHEIASEKLMTDGQTVYGRRVPLHPGMSGRKFLNEAAAAFPKFYATEFARRMRRF